MDSWPTENQRSTTASHVLKKNGKKYPAVEKLSLGGCRKIRLVLDIVQAAKETPNVLFHSLNPRYPLIDFLYRDEEGAFHAFQATIGNKHRADLTRIQELEQQVSEGKLSLYFLVPSEKLKGFVTTPVIDQDEIASCNIWKVGVPAPKDKVVSKVTRLGHAIAHSLACNGRYLPKTRWSKKLLVSRS